MQAIEFEQVSYQVRPDFYAKPHRLLCNVSFRVGQGEVFGFLGPNGAGKTTTIKVLLNLLRPSQGRALILGVPAASPRARVRVGFLPERAFYPPHLSAYEFVVGHALLAGMGFAEAKKRAQKALQRTGVAHAAKRRLATFSKGMLQRAGLAQAIVAEPAVVILDEPMSGLDPVGRREVRHLLQDLGRAGTTVFFSTHILPDVELICDRVAILVGGQLRQIGPLRELVAGLAQGVEVTLGPCDADALSALQAHAQTHRAHAAGHSFDTANQAAANALIDAARARQVPVVAVSAGHGGLEQLFVGEAKR